MSKYIDIPKIDLHAHFVPKAYIEAMNTYLGENPDRFPMPNFTEEQMMDFMDKSNIKYSVLSVSSPHINFSTKEVNKGIARACNEELAALVKRHPDKLGFFATVSVPYVDDAIEEIAYSMDELGALGVSLPTNSRGTYISDDSLIPMFEELNKRGAWVAFHPNKPGRVPEGVGKMVPESIVEFFFDTTRTIADLILRGRITNYPNIKFIVPHCGAVLPVILDRIHMFASDILVPKGVLPKDFDIYQIARSLYFDLAGYCANTQLKTMLDIADENKILFGSDIPFTPAPAIEKWGAPLCSADYLTDEQLEKFFYKNALVHFKHVEIK